MTTIPLEHQQRCRTCQQIYDARVLDDVLFHLHDDTPGVESNIVGKRVDTPPQPPS